jgi:hypothetical protein
MTLSSICLEDWRELNYLHLSHLIYLTRRTKVGWKESLDIWHLKIVKDDAKILAM